MLSDLLDGDFRVWGLFANLVQPIFQGGRLRAGVDASQANTEAALLDFGGHALAAFAEIEGALNEEGRLASRTRLLQSALDETKRSQTWSERRYRAGVGSRLDMLFASQTVLTTERDWLAAQRSRLVNRVNLLLALGGGWQAEDPER